MEATDDIIDGIVGEQVSKIYGLLERALASDDDERIAGAEQALKLGTACSGTDAPALVSETNFGRLCVVCD